MRRPDSNQPWAPPLTAIATLAEGQSGGKLWMAAANGKCDEVEEMLEGSIRDFYRENIDYTDDIGWTALRAAINYNNLDCAKSLLDHGASVDYADLRGYTPLMGVLVTSDAPEAMVRRRRAARRACS